MSQAREQSNNSLDSTGLPSIANAELVRHYDNVFDSDSIWRMRQQLRRDGYVRLTNLLTDELKARLRHEVTALTETRSRRIDIKVQTTDNSPRKMRTVNYTEISNASPFISELYRLPGLRSLLDRIAESAVRDCDFDNERMTITRQDQIGDTHGWHWGDYQWALIFIVEAPPIDHGGMLQCVPHTIWNKANPEVHRHLVENPIRTYMHETGDIYFFATDTTLHRTYPLERDGTRIILNFTFAGHRDLERQHGHETMDAIYDF
ncbi:HalD/BesD family halogenase [Methylobacterium sp. SyP6R]|uniref:HalD/BesD family halogenase n=1 Tax=Methylobacterium sp. SyP6R TaxID=2718876 RepID=UPI001F39FCF4|nr:hypothetical protein [Methylobacterium sp. SyP6R]MCF4126196.1 hypothetical protein [Methylobacterium sp. SyP6R]